MKVKTLKAGTRTIAATIKMTAEEVETSTSLATGAEAAEINVEHEDGKVTRFFVSLRINKQGRATCEVATSIRDGNQTISKRVTGTRR